MKKNLLAIAAFVLGLSATASAQDMMATPAVGKPTPKVEQATTPAPAKMEKAVPAASMEKTTAKKHKKHRRHKKSSKKASK